MLRLGGSLVIPCTFVITSISRVIMCTRVFVESVYKGIEGNTCEYTIESDSQTFKSNSVDLSRVLFGN